MGEELTIADALTELKRIKKLLNKRAKYLARYSSKRRGAKDEVENQKEFIATQYQSAKDLISRYKAIKLAINQSNLTTILEFEGKIFSVAEAILFKQQFYEMTNQILNSFSPATGRSQVDAYTRIVGGLSGLTQEQLEKIDMVPELLYNEAEIIKSKEEQLNLYSYVDALIEKSNHNTQITL